MSYEHVMSKLGLEYSLKPPQIQVIDNVLEPRSNTLVIWPTSYGKSVCFLLPALILDEVSVIH